MESVKALVAQSYLILWDSMSCSPPGSSVHGIFQAKILEQVAISTPQNLCDSGMEPGFPALLADSLPSEPPGKPLSVEWVLKNQTMCCREKITLFFSSYTASHYHHHSTLQGHIWHCEYSVHFSKADNSSKKKNAEFSLPYDCA